MNQHDVPVTGTALMWQEILSQPALVDAELSRLRREAMQAVGHWQRSPGTIYLVGTGDSYLAARSSAYLFAHYLGRWPVAWPTREFTHYCPATAQDLVIVISTSGSAAAATCAAVAADTGSRVVGLTAEMTSPLARACPWVLRLPASWTRCTPHTRDYMAALLALSCLTESIAGTPLAPLQDMSATLRAAIDMAQAGIAALSCPVASTYFFVGAGPLWPTAEYGAAKFWEAGGLPAFAQELEEVAHGLHLTVSEGDVVVVLVREGVHSRLARRLASGFRTLGAHPVILTDSADAFSEMPCVTFPPVPEEWVHMAACVPLQVLCHHVAERANLNVVQSRGGRDARGLYDEVRRAWLA